MLNQNPILLPSTKTMFFPTTSHQCTPIVTLIKVMIQLQKNSSKYLNGVRGNGAKLLDKILDQASQITRRPDRLPQL